MHAIGPRRLLVALGATTLILTIGIGSVAAAGPRAATRGAGPAAPVPVVAGTLTTDQRAALAGMAEEEKLAQDLYAAFAAQYPSAVWSRIGAAEAAHVAAIRTLLARYAIADPTAGLPAGTFASPAVADMYASLLAQGAVSETAAFGVGKLVEIDDIAKLDAAAIGVTASDVLRVYANLRTASTQHLSAFTRLLPN